MDFTEAQIVTAKTLVKWYTEHGFEKDKARLEVARILKSYEHKKIKAAMSSTSCTSPSQLKKILLGKPTFKNESGDY